jgi:chromosome segregation ATPase
MQLNALTESNTNVQAELEKKNLECSELQKDLENQLEELSITSKSWKKSIVTINEDLISLKADYQALKEENNQKKDELSRLHQLTTQFTQTIAEKDLQIQKLTKSVKEIEEKAKADLEQTKKTLEDKLDLSVSENEAKLARLVSENRLIALKLEGEHQALLAATKELKNTRSAHESTMKEIETYKEKYQGFKEAIAEEVDNFVHGFLK